MRKDSNGQGIFLLCLALVIVIIVASACSIVNKSNNNNSISFNKLELPSEEPLPFNSSSTAQTEEPTEEPSETPTEEPTEELSEEPLETLEYTDEDTDETGEASTEESPEEIIDVPVDLESAPADETYVDEDPEKQGTIFEERYSALSIEEKFELLSEFFPDGSYWNHFYIDTDNMSYYQRAMTVTDIPCENVYGLNSCNEYTGMMDIVFKYFYDIQCLGFAGMVSDFLFGETADIKVIEDEYYSWDDIEVGDCIRFIYADHSAIVCDKDDYSLTLLECNRDYESCEIEWGRTLTQDELDAYGFAIIKRVSDGEGDYTYDDFIYYWNNSNASDINYGHGERWS